MKTRLRVLRAEKEWSQAELAAQHLYCLSVFGFSQDIGEIGHHGLLCGLERHVETRAMMGRKGTAPETDSVSAVPINGRH